MMRNDVGQSVQQHKIKFYLFNFSQIWNPVSILGTSRLREVRFVLELLIIYQCNKFFLI